MNSIEFYSELIHWILNHVTESNMFIVQSVATCSALVWLLIRAWQTLWKPVPELISILGVEVPDAPEVSLAGIKSDSITLHLSRPEQHKPVTRYLIQVNGVNVGDSQPRETAITITGLRPGHFYNVRVIAVGANNFQAGSQVIRLRTFGRNGRPVLDNRRSPSYPPLEDLESLTEEEALVEQQKHVVGVEAAALPEISQAMVREQSGGAGGTSGQRRNTGGRKHSSSTAGADHGMLAAIAAKPTESMHQLTERLEAINKEKDDITTQMAREGDEFRFQITDMTRERDEKRQSLKEKEEASEKLKKEVHQSERLNRQAQNKKAQKEKVLKDKQQERQKMQEDMVRWKQEIDKMRAERESWRKEKEDLEMFQGKNTEKLQETIRRQQNSLIGVEEEIRIKGLQIKELEAERRKLPGAEENEESRLRATRGEQEDQEWVTTERNLLDHLTIESKRHRDIQASISQATKRLSQLEASSNNAALLMYQGNSSGVDFDHANLAAQTKSRRPRNRRSRTNIISSPIAAYPIGETQFPSARAYNSLHTTTSPSYAPGPYMDLSNDTAMVPLSEQMSGISEDDFRGLAAGAPLSPTATALLPSNIFADDDPPSPGAGSMTSVGPALYSNHNSFEDGPQSPGSSSPSASLLSSTQNSSQSLTNYGIASRDYGEKDRGSVLSPRTDFGAIGSPITIEHSSTHKGLRDLFTLPRARGKTSLDEGPVFGSLKQAQSQSLPRSVKESEAMVNSHRKISFSSGWPSFLQRASTAAEPATEGNGPAPARNTGARKRRGFNMFGSSIDEPGAYPDRDPSSPRPLSVASSDLPRPSTDSAPFGWAPAPDNVINRNSPLVTNWSIQHQPQPQLTWSTNPSRRPSFQHGSSTALASGIASDDDEFLPPSDAINGHASPPPAIGVIGTRPSSSHKPITPKLNPAAPAFKGFSFTRSSRTEKDKGKGKGNVTDTNASPEDGPHASQNSNASSPLNPRKSRDTPSIRTQNSTAESYESLEPSSSNTPSELVTPSGSKDKDSAFRQLLRKGSSSKFNISSFRNKESGLFGGKKGGSVANYDRNTPVERDGSLDGFGEDTVSRSVDSVTSSPMLGSAGSGEGRAKDKEGRLSTWGRFGLKIGKGRESMDNEHSESDMLSADDEV